MTATGSVCVAGHSHACDDAVGERPVSRTPFLRNDGRKRSRKKSEQKKGPSCVERLSGARVDGLSILLGKARLCGFLCQAIVIKVSWLCLIGFCLLKFLGPGIFLPNPEPLEAQGIEIGVRI